MNQDLTIHESAILDPLSNEGAEWEALVADNSCSGFMQSLHWGRFKEACQQTVIQLIIRKSGKQIAGVLLYTCPDDKKPTIMLSPYGPVLPYEDPLLASKCLRLLIEKSEEIAARLNVLSWRIEPRIEGTGPKLLQEFAGGPVNLVPAETLYLDLSKSEEELLSEMKAKCRYNIFLAERRGVTVKEESGAEAAKILYELLEEAADRDDFYLEHQSFFDALINNLMPSGMLKLLIAEHEGSRLGVLVLIIHGRKATYLYGGISNLKRNLMPGYALQWEAIKTAKAAACLSYDFYGYDQFQSPAHSYARFSRFKSGFGGRAVRFIGAQDYIFMDKLVDNIIEFFKDIPQKTLQESSSI
ncbi:MAG: peptidoglycan bridge formation glycyltransferase FemA/FemB family protein [Candidatus Obscuribacterales bacterium]|nr:peptidoglycan bridge formation glycyltransferase FemA/FemB family protein [Candidatus Obscuribacterales bacterium]